MSDPYEHDPHEGDLILDSFGDVWLSVMDGGMATRATASGIVSIGISQLKGAYGPLLVMRRDDVSDAFLAFQADTEARLMRWDR